MAVITGDNADNKLKGANQGDDISGRGGADTLRGEVGADTISGGLGNDTASGGAGDDLIAGGNGDDLLFGFSRAGVSGENDDIVATRVGSGFSNSLFACSAPGDPGRLFVVEQHEARIQILDPSTGNVNAAAFLDLDNGEISAGGEQGLLSVAFHPDYEANGEFFVFLTNPAGDIEVRRYTRSDGNPDVADPDSGDIILTITDPGIAANHNGGWMSFGPDGKLYIAVGDGGPGNDPNNYAQNKDVLFGKILRIDVDGDDFAGDPLRDYAIPTDNPFAGATAGADEIWAYGLRNPWRPSFDSATGDLYIADVGQGLREEINFQLASSAGGQNYGWRVIEGTNPTGLPPVTNPPPDDPSLIAPIHEYSHGAAPDGGFSVTGGYVYHGTAPGMQGVYFFADFVTEQLWSFQVVDGKAVDFANRTAQLTVDFGTVDNIASFAEDGNGNLYVVGLDGEIHRLDPEAAAGDGSDTINGGAGDDRIYGCVGDDRLNGGIGVDRMSGGQGNDTLAGGTEADRLAGGRHADVLNGNQGDDTMIGGDGADIFYFAGGSGADRIADFEDGIDTIRLASSLGLEDVADALGHAVQAAGNVLFTFDGGETLLVFNTTKAELADDIAVLG